MSELNIAQGISDTNTVNSITFTNAISICMSKYFDFKGRATRSEYWWFYLFTILLSWGAILVDNTQVLSLLVNLVLMIPVFSAGARRLHDTNRSGWWQLLILTIIGIIPLIVLLSIEGKKEDNIHGNPV